MPNPTPIPLTPRVTALLAQVERLAARSPRQPVPETLGEVAKSLFAAARKILGPEAGRLLRLGTGDLAGLSVALGQLAAALRASEPAPPAKGKPATPAVGASQKPRYDGVEPGFRSKLYKRLCQPENLRYMQGYRDAQAGRPPIAPITELDVIPEK